MTEKERRVALLNEDLQAGRVKLPDDYEFKREYLGEWKEPADAMAYTMTAPRGAAHLCALCREPIALDPGVYTAAQIDQRIAAHHAVCPKRPIAVGDYVRWTSPMDSRAWADGVVTLRYPSAAMGSLGKDAAFDVKIAAVGDWTGRANHPEVGETETVAIHALRRIPRPAEAQATVPAARRVFPQGASHFKPCGTCGEAWGQHFGVACELPRMEGYESGPVCAPGCPCGAHVTNAAAPALVDGLDREQCLARWMENRLAVEGRYAPPNAMTRMQIDVARAMWLERYGAARSAELRTKVAAGREAERCRVRVDVQDVE